MRSMSRSTGTVASTTLVATIVIGSFSTAPLARAEGHAINGTYIATSVGEWAKTNEVFHDEGRCEARGRSPPRARPPRTAAVR